MNKDIFGIAENIGKQHARKELLHGDESFAMHGSVRNAHKPDNGNASSCTAVAAQVKSVKGASVLTVTQTTRVKLVISKQNDVEWNR